MSKTLSSTSFNRLFFFSLPKGIWCPLSVAVIIVFMELVEFGEGVQILECLYYFVLLLILTIVPLLVFRVEGDYRTLQKISADCYVIGNVRFSRSEIISIQLDRQKIDLFEGRYFYYSFFLITVVSNSDAFEKEIEYKFKISPKHRLINLVTFGSYQNHLDKFIYPSIRLENFEHIFG